MKMKIGLPAQMAIGFTLGVVAGIAFPHFNLPTGWFKPLGDLFINLIRMVVVPLVVSTIIAGSASIDDTGKLGRVATKTLLFYVVTTAIAIAIALFFANMLSPGEGLSIKTEGVQAIKVEESSGNFVDALLSIVPVNPIDGMIKGNMLQIIIFAMLFGFCTSAVGKPGIPVRIFFEQMGEAMIKVTSMIMLYSPIGVFGLIAQTTVTHGIAVLMPLIKVIGVMYFSCIVFIIIAYLPLVKYSKLSVFKFFKTVAQPMLIAFTTCSSAAALSSNLIQVQKLGASKAVSSFSIPLGNTINNGGTAVYMGLISIFVAQIYGVDMTLEKQVQVIVTGVIASIGSIGVPSAALIMCTIVFKQVGIPLEGIALIAGIDRIMDMARTTLNVLGDAAVACAVSTWEGDFSEEEGRKFTEECESINKPLAVDNSY